jgi:CBS domain-containing protein
MNVSEIMADKVIFLSENETVAKALTLMYENNVNQIPVLDHDGRYFGMVFAKEFRNSNLVPSSKLKSFIVKTSSVATTESIERCTQLILTSGNRALPVVENGKLVGMISETDVIATADFGHASVDQVMSGAVVIEENSTLDNALAKMRRYNIARLPVINVDGVLTGIINALEITRVVAKPKERIGKAPGVGSVTGVGDVKVRDIMKRAVSVETGTRLNNLIDIFRNNEEIVVVGNRRPIGIVTQRDALEIMLPERKGPRVHVAHVDGDVRRTIEDQMARFLKKIQGKLENVQTVIVYADKHKTRKYSLRARLFTGKQVISSKAVGYDPLSASKELIARLDRHIKYKHSQKFNKRQHAKESVRILTQNLQETGADEEI